MTGALPTELTAQNRFICRLFEVFHNLEINQLFACYRTSSFPTCELQFRSPWAILLSTERKRSGLGSSPAKRSSNSAVAKRSAGIPKNLAFVGGPRSLYPLPLQAGASLPQPAAEPGQGI